MVDNQYLTAQEAADILEISVSTLYSYVSRGLIRSEAIGKDKRTRRYRVEDVYMLKDRKEAHRTPEKLTENALYWGTPVMESALTLVTNGSLYYRGFDVVSLAVNHTVEEVAALMWMGTLDVDDSQIYDPERPVFSADMAAVLDQITEMAPVEAFQVMLPIAATHDLAAYNMRPAAVSQTGGHILRLLASVTTGTPSPGGLSVVDTLHQGWDLGDSNAKALLNAALILCADNELNVSSFTVRCAASAGATPYAAVVAGLVALQGVKHGGFIERVEALFREISSPGDVRPAIERRLKRGEEIPGFGHPFYPRGDPRGKELVELTREAYAGSEVAEIASAIASETHRLMGEYPRVDFGLVTLAHTLDLPPGSAIALFALGRAIGWIGHAIEQYQMDRIIRPRAQYIGAPPRN